MRKLEVYSPEDLDTAIRTLGPNEAIITESCYETPRGGPTYHGVRPTDDGWQAVYWVDDESCYGSHVIKDLDELYAMFDWDEDWPLTAVTDGHPRYWEVFG